MLWTWKDTMRPSCILLFLCVLISASHATGDVDDDDLAASPARQNAVLIPQRPQSVADIADLSEVNDDDDTLSARYPEFSNDFIGGLIVRGKDRAEELFGVSLESRLSDGEIADFSKRDSARPVVVASEFPVVDNGSAAAGLGRFGGMFERVIPISQRANVLLDITKGISERYVELTKVRNGMAVGIFLVCFLSEKTSEVIPANLAKKPLIDCLIDCIKICFSIWLSKDKLIDWVRLGIYHFFEWRSWSPLFFWLYFPCTLYVFFCFRSGKERGKRQFFTSGLFGLSVPQFRSICPVPKEYAWQWIRPCAFSTGLLILFLELFLLYKGIHWYPCYSHSTQPHYRHVRCQSTGQWAASATTVCFIFPKKMLRINLSSFFVLWFVFFIRFPSN